MESEEPKLPAVRSIAWLDGWRGYSQLVEYVNKCDSEESEGNDAGPARSPADRTNGKSAGEKPRACSVPGKQSKHKLQAAAVKLTEPEQCRATLHWSAKCADIRSCIA